MFESLAGGAFDPKQIGASLLTQCHHNRPSRQFVLCYCIAVSCTFVASLYTIVPADVRKLARSDKRQVKWRALAVVLVSVALTVAYPIVFCVADANMETDMRIEKESRPIGMSALCLMGWCRPNTMLSLTETENSWYLFRVLFHTATLYFGPLVAIALRIHVGRTHVLDKFSCSPRIRRTKSAFSVSTSPKSVNRSRASSADFPSKSIKRNGSVGSGLSKAAEHHSQHYYREPYTVGYHMAFYEVIVQPLIHDFFQSADPASVRWNRFRDLLLAPLAEEIVFRAGLVGPLLASGMHPTTVARVAPLFFGVAHIHHAYLRIYQKGERAGGVAIATLFQFTYTSLFGTYVAHAYIRTGSVMAVFLSHAFCNTMGLPDLSFLQRHGGTTLSCVHGYKRIILMAYLAGIVLFYLGFDSNSYYSQFPQHSVLPVMLDLSYES
jgi:prenyl protein peptidase